MSNHWRAPVVGVATYSIIRLWNKGDKAGAGIGMFLTLLGPVGCFILLCLVILAIVNFWIWLVGFAIVAGTVIKIFMMQAIPKYFFNAGCWWTTKGDVPHIVDTAWMQKNYTKEQRVGMQRKFLKALGKYRKDYPNMSLDVL